MALQHHMGIAGNRVPEQDPTILRTTHDPLTIRRHANAKYKVLDEDQQSVGTLGGFDRTRGQFEPVERTR